MKKIIISLVLMLVSLVAFAGERNFDERGNLSAINDNEMNGAFYNATLHFTAKGKLYLADYTADKLFFFITDGGRSLLNS